MRTFFIISACVSAVVIIGYVLLRLLLCAIIIYGDMLKRKGLDKKR